MKKLLSFVLVIISLLLTLSSCDIFSPSDDDNETDANVFDSLGEMAKNDYNAVTVNISSEYEGETLKDIYNITKDGTKTTVKYTCQRYSNFSEGNIPEEYIKTYTGTIVTENDKIISKDGDDVYIAFTEINVKNFNFSENVFSNTTNESGVFKAKIQNPSSFFSNNTLKLSDAEIEVKYSTTFENITIKYKSESGALITSTYAFS